jgi:hypothetical protein
MENKCTLVSLVLGFLTVSLAGCQVPSNNPSVAQAAVEVNRVGANQAVSPVIQDEVILEGWNNLRSLNESIEVNGVLLSGESLSQFVVDNQIPVVWGSDEICGGASCSRLYCGPDGNCSYEDGRPGIDPIYLNPAISTQNVGKMDRLVSELAHEIYHRMRPFGAGTITQIEEFWAFYVGAQVVNSNWPEFDGVDPQDPEQLQNWFYTHSLNGYLKLTSYPGGVAPSSKASPVSRTLASEPIE